MNTRRMTSAQLRSLATRLDVMSYVVDDDGETTVHLTSLPVLDGAKRRLGYMVRTEDDTWTFEINRPMEPTPIPAIFGITDGVVQEARDRVIGQHGLVSAFGAPSFESHDFLGEPAAFDEPPTEHPVGGDFF